ncbi:hypothetical protein ABN028_04215 [Actinopolymorpha sp. B17G11]|uniref:hypothetical protein n=1 Tax=Actinopolymorpha sp. B17G11 TaxID=3160861 RepID=UPI0032E431E6
MSDVEEAITQAHHEEWARVVAALTRRSGDLDIASARCPGLSPLGYCSPPPRSSESSGVFLSAWRTTAPAHTECGLSPGRWDG